MLSSQCQCDVLVLHLTWSVCVCVVCAAYSDAVRDNQQPTKCSFINAYIFYVDGSTWWWSGCDNLQIHTVGPQVWNASPSSSFHRWIYCKTWHRVNRWHKIITIVYTGVVDSINHAVHCKWTAIYKILYHRSHNILDSHFNFIFRSDRITSMVVDGNFLLKYSRHSLPPPPDIQAKRRQCQTSNKNFIVRNTNQRRRQRMQIMSSIAGLVHSLSLSISVLIRSNKTTMMINGAATSQIILKF